MNWGLLLNSLGVAGGVMLLAGALGFLFALALSGLGGRAQRFGLAGSLVVLALPPFLVVNCWLDLTGTNGVFQAWLPINIYSLPGTVLVLSLMFWPISMLTAWSSWQRITPELMEIEPDMEGAALIRWLLWPSARPALLCAMGLIFVLALNNFSVPAILQVKVLPAELWVAFNTKMDHEAAWLASLPLILIALLFLILMRRADVAWPGQQQKISASLLRKRLGPGWFAVSIFSGLAILLFSLVIPIGELVGGSNACPRLLPAFLAGWPALFNSLWLGVSTASLVVGITICLILFTSRTFNRDRFAAITYQRFNGFALVAWLPFLVPGVLLGILLIYTMNRAPLLWLYQSAWVMLLALLFRYIAPGGFGVRAALHAVDQNLVDAARLEGASRWQVFRLAVWPQVSRQLLAAWYVVYLLCLWDVETLVLIQPPGGETAALRIFNLLHYGHHPDVNALCLWLLLLALLPFMGAGLFKVFVARFRQHPDLIIQSAGLVSMVAFLTGCGPASPMVDTPVKSRFFISVQVIGERGASLGKFNKPRSVSVDREDNLYVVDMTGRVQKFSPDGKYLLSWQMPETDLGKAKGLGLDKNGNVLVVEPHYQRVNHFNTQGKLVAQWGVKGTNAGQFILPRAVAVDKAGNLFISEYTEAERVQKFSGTDKKLLSGWGKLGNGAGEFNRAEGLGMDTEDRVYVADSCNHRIQIFDADGRFLRSHGKAGQGGGDMSYPYDVRVDQAGTQYVCEFGNSRIQIFDAKDQSLEILGESGAAPGKFSNPWGIALDSQGNLYVADSGNHRVQKFIRRRQ
jgi:ABC-type Fe3+ transport system permease subunit/sugar lactone lactonase YvrE